MEPSRAKLRTRRLVRGVLVILFVAALPYAVIGWQHMAMGDGLLLDLTVTTSADIPPRTVVVSVRDSEGHPVPRGGVRLFHSSGSGFARLDADGVGSDTIGEPSVEDIEFGIHEPAGGRDRLPEWTRFFRRGGFSVRETGVRLDIRLRWAQAW